MDRLRTGVAVGVLAAFWLTPMQAQTLTPRAQTQHLLRRFSFSASPQMVTTVTTLGTAGWLTQQDNFASLDDSGSERETLPTALVNGQLPDFNVFERVVMQHMAFTPRQLQAKLELHWLDHFAVSLAKIGDPAVMYHYDQTIRANALGNFGNLLSAVANEEAMLEWLDNNGNMGSEPNENFARECMQLYAVGLNRLNDDGSLQLDTNGLPIPAYNQTDVKMIAEAITGYGVVYDYTNNNPQTRFSVQYFPAKHYNGPIKIFGKTIAVPTDGTALAFMMGRLARRESTAPFEVTELLRRFASETPSARYIAELVGVWRATENAPDQIAQVITAMVNDPEFDQDYHSMSRQPVELVIDTLRALPGQMQATANASPGGSLLWELNGLSQEVFYPPSVFSFYRPGQLNALTNTNVVLYRTGVLANITSADPTNSYTDTYIDIPALRAAIGSTQAEDIATYLLDALLDGGTAQQKAAIDSVLTGTSTDNQIRSAMWLLLNTPDYAVN